MKKTIFNFCLRYKKILISTIIFLFFLILTTLFYANLSVKNKIKDQNAEIKKLKERDYTEPLDENQVFSTNEQIVDNKNADNKSKIYKNSSGLKENKDSKKKSNVNKQAIKKSGSNKQRAIQTIDELHAGIKMINRDYTNNNYKEINQLIRSTYDINRMISMIIGNTWNKVTKEKKGEMEKAFEEYIVKNYIKRFIKVKNPNFESLETKKVGGNYIMVKSILKLGSGDNIKIDYLLILTDEKWRVFDVLLDGSISEIATKKSEFRGFINNGNIDPLIKALQKMNSKLID